MTVFVHPYQGAYDLDWSSDYNGILTEEDMAQRKAEWVGWVDTALPLTKELYLRLPADEKKRYRRLSVWASAGGLSLPSGRSAIKAFKQIRRRWEDVAEKRARDIRQKAGWTGKNFRTSPSGIKRGPNGQYFGRFALPGAEYSRGAWDGVLKPGLKFTV